MNAESKFVIEPYMDGIGEYKAQGSIYEMWKYWFKLLKFFFHFYRFVASSYGHDATAPTATKQPTSPTPIRTSATLATAGPTPSTYQQHGN